VEKTKAPYAIVVVDGNMTLTDGKTFEQLHRGPMDFHRCEVPLGTPIKLYTASKKANFLFED
jgi:hypothetical protein